MAASLTAATKATRSGVDSVPSVAEELDVVELGAVELVVVELVGACAAGEGDASPVVAHDVSTTQSVIANTSGERMAGVSVPDPWR